MPSMPSRFLGEMPPDLVEGLDLHAGCISEEEDDFEVEPEAARTRTRRGTAEPEAADSGSEAIPGTLAELRTYVQRRFSRPAAPEPGEGPVFKPGSRVRHAQFGDGIILRRERSGNEIKLTITFSRAGRKTLIERYARLEAL
jgi:DNA helicase-2/ATP-dependent DNA helicase PcrA